jgi:hypothetical protein
MPLLFSPTFGVAIIAGYTGISGTGLAASTLECPGLSEEDQMSDHAVNALFAVTSVTMVAVLANTFVTSFWARRTIQAIEGRRQT